MNTSNDKNFEVQAANNADIESWRAFLDLPIEITVELGRTKVALKSILDLKLDCIITLKRPSGASIDVLASDQCIARGEVISFEDSVGIRINEIVTQKSK